MVGDRFNVIDKVKGGGMVRRWQKRLRDASRVDLASLRQYRSEARVLRSQLAELIHVADERLSTASGGLQKPPTADWAWRPEIWRGRLALTGHVAPKSGQAVGKELRLFHDCPRQELVVRQLRNVGSDDLAPYGLRLDVMAFEGSFLSYAVDLPDEVLDELKKTHLIGMAVRAELERPIKIFSRLNIQHGPNTEQIVRELPLHETEVMVEFDLAYTHLNEKRAEGVWVDIIFDTPAMNQINLRDLTFVRRPRAAL